MNDIDQVSAWKKVAAELDFVVDAPCVLMLPGGASVKAAAHVKQFGAQNGMIVDPVWEALAPHARALAAAGYGYSCMTLGLASSRESLIEILRDWGWAAPGPAPNWLAG